MKVMIIQGPNLNMLGVRDPRLYGPVKLETIHENIQRQAQETGVEVSFFQSNFEGEIVDKIQECFGVYDGIIINVDAGMLIKCVASYFNLDNFYPEVKDLKLDKTLYDSLKNEFELYKKDNDVNAKLDNNLKEHLNTLDSKQIHLELKKYYQNRLTNIEVLKYIKKLIDDKDLYDYDMYLNYTKEQCKKLYKKLNSIK